MSSLARKRLARGTAVVQTCRAAISRRQSCNQQRQHPVHCCTHHAVRQQNHLGTPASEEELVIPPNRSHRIQLVLFREGRTGTPSFRAKPATSTWQQKPVSEKRRVQTRVCCTSSCIWRCQKPFAGPSTTTTHGYFLTNVCGCSLWRLSDRRTNDRVCAWEANEFKYIRRVSTALSTAARAHSLTSPDG